jgi:hypothetical protein
VPPGTDNVGESEVDTQDDGEMTEPKYAGTRSPEPVPAGKAASTVGSPASPAAASRLESDEEHAEAIRARDNPTAIKETAKRWRMKVSKIRGKSNFGDHSTTEST